jgi:hypothetical protein
MYQLRCSRQLKYAGLLVALLSATSLLSGCAGVMHNMGYAPMQPPAQEACAKSPVLLTNLNQPIRNRHYQLPDGTRCSENSYVKAEQPREKEQTKKAREANQPQAEHFFKKLFET